MSWLMLAGVATGTAPMPKPIPVALVADQFGPLEMPRLFALGLLAHFGYGAVAGVVFALVGRRATWRWGLAYGGLLWLVVGLAWLPHLGWGVFGVSTDGAIAVVTLVLHLIYGGALGCCCRAFTRPVTQPGRGSSADSTSTIAMGQVMGQRIAGAKSHGGDQPAP